MPKALCLTGLVIAILVFLIFLSDLLFGMIGMVSLGTLQDVQHADGYHVPALRHRFGLCQLDQLQRVEVAPFMFLVAQFFVRSRIGQKIKGQKIVHLEPLVIMRRLCCTSIKLCR